MVRVCFAASGEDLGLDCEPDSVLALKQLLRTRCPGRSRFQLRVLSGGEELQDACVAVGELELLVLNHLEANEEREAAFSDACSCGDMEAVERCLRSLQVRSCFL